MEIIELIFGAIEACNCFLGILTLFVDGTAAYSGVKTYQQRKQAKEASKENPRADYKQPSWVPFLFLVSFGVIITALLFTSWYQSAPRR